MLAVWTSYPRSTDAVPLYMDLTLVLNGEARVVATRSAREAVADSIMCESWHAEKRKKISKQGPYKIVFRTEVNDGGAGTRDRNQRALAAQCSWYYTS